jgi:hypothetical protein
VLPDYLELEIRREAMMLSEACAVTETSGRVTPETAPAIAGPIPLGPQRGRARPRARFRAKISRPSASQANRFCRTFRPVDHRKPSPGWKGCAAGDRWPKHDVGR